MMHNSSTELLKIAALFDQFTVSDEEEAIKMEEYLYSLRKEINSGNPELQGLYDFIYFQLERYESSIEKTNVSGLEALKYLMKEHNHKQIDLKDIAPKSVISEILSGKRILNLGQIKRLAKKYNVRPSVFM